MLLLTLAGCASARPEPWEAMLDSKNCSGAVAYLQQSEEWVGRREEKLAWVYANCGDLRAAVQHYTVAARYGNERARDNLSQLGAPIPPLDLQGYFQ